MPFLWALTHSWRGVECILIHAGPWYWPIIKTNAKYISLEAEAWQQLKTLSIGIKQHCWPAESPEPDSIPGKNSVKSLAWNAKITNQSAEQMAHFVVHLVIRLTLGRLLSPILPSITFVLLYQSQLQEHERILELARPSMKPILVGHHAALSEKLNPGLNILTWTSMNIDSYIHNLHKVVD